MKSLILTFLVIGVFLTLLGLLTNADEADRRFTNFFIFCVGATILVADTVATVVWLILNR